MVKELCNKIIYDDFRSKTVLTNDEIKILDMLILKYSIIKISDKCKMSDRNVSRIIKELKRKYTNYKTLEMAKLDVFNS